MNRFLALATVCLLASAATAQVSTLSNPPGGTVSSLTQLPTISNNTLLGNISGGSATPSALTASQSKTLLSIANTDVSGLGTAATTATGTSGHTLPFLDGANTFSGANIFQNNKIIVNGTSNAIPTNLSPGGASYQYETASGAAITGFGGTFDVTLYNYLGSYALGVSHGTTNVVVVGSLGVGGVTAFNTSGVLQAASFPALTGDVTTSAGALGTTIAAGSVSLAKQANFAATSLQGNPTGSPAAPSAITLAGGLGFSGTTLTAAGALTPTSVASSGAISGTSITGTTTILSSGATSGIGYATGAGGTVTQITSRTTGVTLNKACGAITLVSAAGSATASSFTVTDSAVAATDVVVVNQKSGTDKYLSEITNVAAGSFVITSQTTGGTTTETPVFNFCVIKGVAA